jgi:hypothetical protein
MPRYFTLHQAERLLPDLERALRDAVFHKSEAEKAGRELEENSARIRLAGGVRVNPGPLLALRAQRDTSAAALQEAVDQIQETGALLKDLDIGLIDFLTRYQDRDACLCWKLGESGITFWHGAEEGFRGRKPIDREFLEGHTGEGYSNRPN